MFKRLENRLFLWLWSRWRKRAELSDLETHISWTIFEVKLRRYNARHQKIDAIHARLVTMPPVSHKK